MNGGRTQGHGKPPEGVLAGEDVPVENDRFNLEQSKIDALMAELRDRGGPYEQMTDEQLRDRIIEIVEQ